MRRTPGMLALFTAKLISTCGSWLTILALSWFVLVTTGSPAQMSAVLTAEFLGVVLLGLPSGQVVARLGVRRTMLIGDASRALLMALIPVLHQAGWLSFPMLLAISFGLGVFTAPYVSSQRLILADLLGPAAYADERLLARANSLIDAATRIAALAGPAIGGVLIAAVGPVEVLWIDAGSYATSLLILLLFVRPGEHAAGESSGGQTSMLAGLQYIRRHRALRRFLLALVLLCVSIPAISACLPVLVLRDLGGDPRLLGVLTAANGAGLAIGSLVALAILPRMGDAALAATTILLCAPLWLMLTGRTPLLVGALFLVGLATPIFAATINTRFTLRAPLEIRPHVMTAMATVENLAYFIAFAAAGPALQATGIRPVFAGIAILATFSAVTFHAALRADHHVPERPAGRISVSQAA
jgi:predicted MFS family arabinose efflux permease